FAPATSSASRLPAGAGTATDTRSALAGPVRGRVDVLARDLPVAQREDVDPVPLERAPVALERRRPLADGEVVAALERPRRESQRRVVAEDLRDVRADGIGALGALVRRVIVEDDLRMVLGVDRVDVVPVPGVVVALDQLAYVHGSIVPRRRSTRSSPTRRVTPSASKRSSSICAVFRPTPSRSRNRASAMRPLASHSATSAARACSNAAAETAYPSPTRTSLPSRSRNRASRGSSTLTGSRPSVASRRAARGRAAGRRRLPTAPAGARCRGRARPPAPAAGRARRAGRRARRAR